MTIRSALTFGGISFQTEAYGHSSKSRRRKFLQVHFLASKYQQLQQNSSSCACVPPRRGTNIENMSQSTRVMLTATWWSLVKTVHFYLVKTLCFNHSSIHCIRLSWNHVQKWGIYNSCFVPVQYGMKVVPT